MLTGAQLAGQLYNSLLGSAYAMTLDQWYDFWWIPAIFAAVVIIIFMIFFDDKVIKDKEDVEASDFKVQRKPVYSSEIPAYYLKALSSA